MGIISVIIVDDHKIFRTGLATMLNSLPNTKVIGEASNGKEFLELFKANPSDLVFMDIKMPEIDGIEATKKAIAIKPNTKIIALTMFGEQDYFQQMVDNGAVGFLLKKADISEIQKAIETVAAGENYYTEGFIEAYSNQKTETPQKKLGVKITKREKEILVHICKGLSNQEIADILFISLRTVHGHRANLLSKIGAKNSIDLAMFAVRNKLVQL